MSTSLPKQNKLISISEASKVLGVSIDTVRRWDKAGILHSERPTGKDRYFSLEELQNYQAGQPLPISEAAIILGVSPTTLRRLEAKGLFKTIRNQAGERVYTKESLKEFQNHGFTRRKRSAEPVEIRNLYAKKPEIPAQPASIPEHEPKPEPELEPCSSKYNFLAVFFTLFCLIVTLAVGHVKLTMAGLLEPISAPMVLGIATPEAKPETSLYLILAIVILLCPLLAFLAYQGLHRRRKQTNSLLHEITLASVDQPKQKEESNIGISDSDKRVFLKLIGSAGVFLFLFSLFNKKAEGLFFKSLPGPVQGKVSLEDSTGKTIDPAQNQPFDGYKISEIEDDTISFYGFMNKDKAWYIMRIDTNSGAVRYARDKANFPSSWENRKNLKFDYFGNLF